MKSQPSDYELLSKQIMKRPVQTGPTVYFVQLRLVKVFPGVRMEDVSSVTFGTEEWFKALRRYNRAERAAHQTKKRKTKQTEAYRDRWEWR